MTQIIHWQTGISCPDFNSFLQDKTFTFTCLQNENKTTWRNSMYYYGFHFKQIKVFNRSTTIKSTCNLKTPTLYLLNTCYSVILTTFPPLVVDIYFLRYLVQSHQIWVISLATILAFWTFRPQPSAWVCSQPGLPFALVFRTYFPIIRPYSPWKHLDLDQSRYT